MSKKLAKLKRRIRRKLNKIAKENQLLRQPIRNSITIYKKIRYVIDTFYVKTDSKTVIFASFGGASYSDSPKALFEYMLRSGEFDEYTLVWAFKKDVNKHRKRLIRLQNEIRKEKGDPSAGPTVIVVKYGVDVWKRYMAQAGYWVLNYKIDDYLRPRKEQVFVQTWHGTPLKRLGYDLEHFDNVLNTEEGIKRRYGIEVKKIDYFLSPSPFATEKFKSAWRMDDFGKGDIILEVGYPRNDILIQYSEKQREEYYLKTFKADSEAVRKKNVVLYAPTYRSDHHTTGVGYTYNDALNFDRLQEELGEDFVILFRAHYFIANRFDFSRYKGFVYNVSGVEDINELYLISDMLITDYSSTLFDFANLKRPMIFYMYDLEHYRDKSNGFYFDPEEELPGPIVRTEAELVDAIRDVTENFEYDEKYRRFNEKFNPLDDGHVCERTIKALFR